MEFILKKIVSFDSIKSGITKKGIEVKTGVQDKEIREYRFQEEESPMDLSSLGKSDFFSTGICIVLKLLFRKIMSRTIPNPVSEYGKLIGIAEIAVDVKLFLIRVRSSLRGHEGISHLRVNIRFIFIVSLELEDE